MVEYAGLIFFISAVDLQETVNRERPDGNTENMDQATIIPIILTSDKTQLSGSASVRAWPLFLTIDNLSNSVRFAPGYHCAQLIAIIPIMMGILC